jgi:hypothetical protein
MRKLACLATLRDSFETLYPIVEQLRSRGIECPIVSPHKTASFAEYRIDVKTAPSADVDVWLVASATDAATVYPKSVVFVERGSGQTYDGDARTYEHDSFSTGRIRNARLFLCPNRFVAARRQNRHPKALAIVVGCARLDMFAVGMHDEVERGVVAFAWKAHREPIPELQSAFQHFMPDLQMTARRLVHSGMRPVVTCHPRARKEVGGWCTRNGYEWWDTDDVLDRAHVLVADNTSVAYEFAALDRPVVMLQPPYWREHVHHGLRFWECIPGPQVGDADRLVSTIVESATADTWGRLRTCAAEIYPVLDGKAAWRSSEAISLLL